jgi:hypothetical protein
VLYAEETMKISLFLLLIFYSVTAVSGEWYPFTTDYKAAPSSSHFNELQIENQLWEYVIKIYDGKFELRELYNYQYMLIDNHTFKISAFCSPLGARNLEEEYLLVHDGGSCFFEVTYDSLTNKFRNFSVNGVA